MVSIWKAWRGFQDPFVVPMLCMVSVNMCQRPWFAFDPLPESSWLSFQQTTTQQLVFWNYPYEPKHDFLKSRALFWNFNCKRFAEFTHESRFSFFQPTKMCGLLQQNAVSFSTNSYSHDILSNVRVLKHEHPGDRPQLLLVCSRELADILNIPVSMIEVYLDRKCWQPEWINDANWLFGSVLKWGKTCCKQMYHFWKGFSPSIFPEISARLFAVYNFWWYVDIPFWHNAQ